MAKVYDNATDLITFARSSSGTALRRVGYGENLVTNSTFDTDTSGWADDSNAGGAIAWNASGHLDLIYTSGTVRASQDISLSQGKVYAIQFKVIAAPASSGFYIDGANVANFVSLGVGSHTVYYTSTTTGSASLQARVFAAGTVSIDNISVREVIFDRATDDLVLFNHPDDTPRIEYGSDGSLKGLLIEEQRTNLLTHSEDFSNAAWTKQGSTAIDSTLVTGPDGTLSGRRLLNFDSETGDRLIEFVSVSNATLTGSIWVKGEGANVGKDIALVVKRNGGTYVADTVDHTLSSEWVRLDGTFTQLPDNTAASLVLKNPDNGNEASEVLIYGAQIEAGSFATSYIPTSGSQETRWADVASIPVTAFGYNQDAGTIVVEASAYAGNTTNANYCSFGNAGLTDFIRLWTWEGAASSVRWTGANFDVTRPFTAGATEVIAGAYAENNYNIALDGSAATPDTAGAQTLDATVVIIGSKTGATEYLNGHIKTLKYYPRRLTDAQLQELTA